MFNLKLRNISSIWYVWLF